MRLVRPSLEYEDAYRAMAEDHVQAGEQRYREALREDFDFCEHVRRLEDESRAIGLRAGYVPGSTFWLLSEDGEIVGEIRLRHVLNKMLDNMGGHIGYDVSPSHRRRGYGTEMLRLTLVEAKKLGLTRVLVACDSDNVGSRKVIQNNGGRLEDERIDPATRKPYERYWIELV